MLGAANLFTRHALNFLATFTLLVISGLNFDLGFLFVPIAIGVYFISNVTIKAIQKKKKTKELGLTRSEYRHIEAQIKLAKNHIQSLSQQFIRVRSVRSFKLLNEMLKLSKRIVGIVHRDPHKFYSVEDFFYSHLPSAVELTKNYTTLSQSQVKDTEIHLALEDTRKALKGLHGTMEEDLKSALSSDLENLRMELDFVKLENDKKRQQIEFRGGK
ncbi:5-bromo-4-chloroindolyl phosphate hydrolase [Lysinibacillus yapensis]|uniref:5-bromo-4-chloroindolyl phosphate hydrolase n=1 Tax=Ureibacillus yapensis TaxID=2304605 RepID=A0A396SCW5_9BACL|nr:5-bromo-4-chloroindolyl phosphate hydrolysis family protein [Lysinibacillus yapensis]RHW37557.1 5-bromo-4-chloroindolyl phosphate hydrolase [Lysinibacillus yapensis]